MKRNGWWRVIFVCWSGCRFRNWESFKLELDLELGDGRVWEFESLAVRRQFVRLVTVFSCSCRLSTSVASFVGLSNLTTLRFQLAYAMRRPRPLVYIDNVPFILFKTCHARSICRHSLLLQSRFSSQDAARTNELCRFQQLRNDCHTDCTCVQFTHSSPHSPLSLLFTLTSLSLSFYSARTCHNLLLHNALSAGLLRAPDNQLLSYWLEVCCRISKCNVCKA